MSLTADTVKIVYFFKSDIFHQIDLKGLGSPWRVGFPKRLPETMPRKNTQFQRVRSCGSAALRPPGVFQSRGCQNQSVDGTDAPEVDDVIHLFLTLELFNSCSSGLYDQIVASLLCFVSFLIEPLLLKFFSLVQLWITMNLETRFLVLKAAKTLVVPSPALKSRSAEAGQDVFFFKIDGRKLEVPIEKSDCCN